MSLLWRSHDGPEGPATLAASTRPASGARTNLEDDAMTRHGPCRHRAVALPWRRSRPRVPTGSPTPVRHDLLGLPPRTFRAKISISDHFHRQIAADSDCYPRAGSSPTPGPARPISEIPISIRLLTAGSFFGDFRAPSGVRNSAWPRAQYRVSCSHSALPPAMLVTTKRISRPLVVASMRAAGKRHGQLPHWLLDARDASSATITNSQIDDPEPSVE